MNYLTAPQLLRVLLKMRKKQGSQTALAHHLGISNSYLSDVLAARRKPGKLILDKLGFERVSVDYYERSKPAKD